jgi:hypothetical protein
MSDAKKAYCFCRKDGAFALTGAESEICCRLNVGANESVVILAGMNNSVS